MKEQSIEKRLWQIVIFIITCVMFFACFTACSTKSYVGCYHPDTYLILEVEKNKVLIELECGGDRHWITNNYDWTDSTIGNILTVLPEFNNKTP